MNTPRTNPLKSQGNRSENRRSSRQQRAQTGAAPHRRIVVFETLHAPQEIIRVAIETAATTRDPERIIAF